MSKKIAILQSNYIPWKGYFDIIAAVDEFVIFDDMQFTKRDWRNRNVIKTPQGKQWLTVPVKVKSKFFQSIKDTELDGRDWVNDHLKALSFNYKKAKFFEEVYELIEPIYKIETEKLTELNVNLLRAVCNYLGIKTQITFSWNYKLAEDRNQRLVDICLQAGASEYISGASAKAYIDETLFLKSDLKLTYFDYSGYPTYAQLWGEFTHEVTVLDLLFNCGKESSKYMKFGT